MKVVSCLLVLLPLVCGYSYKKGAVVQQQQCQPSIVYDVQTTSVVVPSYVTETVDNYVTQTEYLTKTATQYSTVVSTVLQPQYITDTVYKTEYKTQTQHHTQTVYSTEVQVQTDIRYSTVVEPQYVTETEVVVSTVAQEVPRYVTSVEQIQNYVTVTKECYAPQEPQTKYGQPIVFDQQKRW